MQRLRHVDSHSRFQRLRHVDAHSHFQRLRHVDSQTPIHWLRHVDDHSHFQRIRQADAHTPVYRLRLVRVNYRFALPNITIHRCPLALLKNTSRPPPPLALPPFTNRRCLPNLTITTQRSMFKQIINIVLIIMWQRGWINRMHTKLIILLQNK